MSDDPAPIESSITPLISTLTLGGRIFGRAMSRITVEGAIDEIPRDGPLILAANHASNLDAVVLGSWLMPQLGRRIHWLGKKELFDWPIVGWAAANGGVHPVDRGAADVEAFRLAQRILDEGNILFVFPEGTRSPDGSLQEARDGLAVLALRTGAPIVPLGIAGSHGVWPRGQKLPHPGGRVTVRVGRPFRPADELPAGTDRRTAKGLATTLIMERIARILPPSQRGVYAPRSVSDGPGAHGPDRPSYEPVHDTARDRHHARPRSARHRARRPGLSGGSERTPCDNRCMGTVQEVRIAKRTGFCYGVREAIDKAKEASAAGKATHTLGQVVHNEGVVRDLQDLGIQTVESLDDVDHGAAVVIRAHGVRPDVMHRAEERGLEVIDGTCTWVIQEQRELTKLVEEGYTIVLLGTPKHPEVVGLLGFAPDAIVVDEEEEWEAAIPRRKRMALITQSTQPPWKFEKLAAFMVSRAHELKIVNTVCPVTIRRQQDTLEAAGEVDLMVVVGGRSSANTKELTRLCEIAGTAAIQIENVARPDRPGAVREGRRSSA